jgi:YNFM family putative membrane transporter
VTFATLYCTQPLMPVFSEEFGVSPAVASLSLSVTTATLAVSMLVAVSPSFPALLGLRALQGVALAGLPSIAMAYVGEEFHPDGLGSAMGLYVGGIAIGGIAERISTGVLAGTYSPGLLTGGQG